MGNPSIKEHYYKFILYIAVIVLVNIVGVTLFFRADLTQNKIYSLSDASKEAVATLSEPLSIKVFFSNNLPAPHNNTERYLRDLLVEYSASAGRLFNYTFYNVSSEQGDLTKQADDNREIAKNFGIQPVQIRVMENDELKFKNAYMGLVIVHGDLLEKIPAITTTDGLEYQLTTAIQKLNNKVSALLRQTDKIKLTLYLSSSLNTIAPLIGLDQLPTLARGIEKTVDTLNAKNLNLFEFKQVDPKTKADIETVAKRHDLMAMNWPRIADKNIEAGQGVAGLVVAYKGQASTLSLITSMELPLIGTTYQMADPKALEEELTRIMEKMIGINKNIGYLADHGTQTLGQDRMAMMQGRAGNGLQVFNQLLSSRYDIKSIPLKEAGIPDGLNCLIIAKPTEKFSDYELFQIDQALMKGTNLAFFGDAFNEIMPPGGRGMPQYLPLDTGLEKLLTHYGISMKPAYVLDKEAYKHQLPPNQGGGEQTIYFAPLLKESSINNTPEFMNNIKGLVAMQISPLTLEKENIKADQVTATRLLASSDQAWLMEGMINLNPMFITPPTAPEDFAPRDLAYILEGKFESYFAGKKIPVKKVDEKKSDEKEIGEQDISPDTNAVDTAGETVAPKEARGVEGVVAEHKILTSSKPAKIFILGCSQMLQDNMLDPQGRSTNATFILNLIDHMNGEDKIAVMRSKQQTLNPIADINPLFKNVIKTFNIVILPTLVVLFGLGVLVRRNARKKKISKMFQV